MHRPRFFFLLLAASLASASSIRIPPCNTTATRSGNTASFDWDVRYQEQLSCSGQGISYDFLPCEMIEQNGTVIDWGFFSSLEYNPSLSSIQVSGGSFVMNFTQGTPMHSKPGEFVVREASVFITCIEPTTPSSCSVKSNGENGLLLLQASMACPPPVSPSLEYPYLDVSLGTFLLLSGGRAIESREIPVLHDDAEKVFVENTSPSQDLRIGAPTVTLTQGSSTEISVRLSGVLQNGGVVRSGVTEAFSINSDCLSTATKGGSFTVAFSVSSQNQQFPPVTFRVFRACAAPISDGDGMSTASAFFLVLFIILVVLFVVGYMYKFSQKGMRGWEAVPFIDFMRSSWERIRDRLQQRTYTHDSVVSMQVRPKAPYDTGYQDVAD